MPLVNLIKLENCLKSGNLLNPLINYILNASAEPLITLSLSLSPSRATESIIFHLPSFTREKLSIVRFSNISLTETETKDTRARFFPLEQLSRS